MVQTKKMNEAFFAKLQKELTVAGELIRSRQEEKQGLLDEFDQECKRFFFGKISQRSLMSSVKKTNKELQRLDKNIREAIRKARSVSMKTATLVGHQAPIGYRATISGIIGGKVKKKKAKKKSAKKKTAKKRSSKKKR